MGQNCLASRLDSCLVPRLIFSYFVSSRLVSHLVSSFVSSRLSPRLASRLISSRLISSYVTVARRVVEPPSHPLHPLPDPRARRRRRDLSLLSLSLRRQELARLVVRAPPAQVRRQVARARGAAPARAPAPAARAAARRPGRSLIWRERWGRGSHHSTPEKGVRWLGRRSRARFEVARLFTPRDAPVRGVRRLGRAK